MDFTSPCDYFNPTLISNLMKNLSRISEGEQNKLNITFFSLFKTIIPILMDFT